MKIPQSVRKMIESGTPAHLVTLNRDGSPQLTVVWIALDGDEIISAHLMANQKVKNIRRDGRVAISMQSMEKNAMGLTQYVVLYGDAHIVEGGAARIITEVSLDLYCSRSEVSNNGKSTCRLCNPYSS